MDTRNKILSLSDLGKIVADLKKQGQKIVFYNGAFDLLHVGHKIVLEESKSLGDILVVGVNSDSSIKRYKSNLRPIISETERAEMLAALACVDYVVIYDDPTPISFLELIKPDIYAHGEDGSKIYNRAGRCVDPDPKVQLEVENIRKNVGQITIVPSVNQSTTDIIERILKIHKNN